MRTSMDIPDDLLEEAKAIVNAKTKTQAVIMALTEMIQRRRSRRILELKGSMDKSYNYLDSRKKR